MSEFLHTLLSLSVSGTLMALLLLSLRYIFLRKMPAWVYYYLWIIVLLRLILPVPAVFVPQTAIVESPEIQPSVVVHQAATEQGRVYLPTMRAQAALLSLYPRLSRNRGKETLIFMLCYGQRSYLPFGSPAQ